MSIQDLTVEDLRKRCDELQELYKVAHGHRCRLTHLVRRLIANIQVLIIMHESPGFYNAEKAIEGARKDWNDANDQQMAISNTWEKREAKTD